MKTGHYEELKPSHHKLEQTTLEDKMFKMELLSLSPSGSLQVISLKDNDKNTISKMAITNVNIIKAFTASQEEGLLTLVAAKVTNTWTSSLVYWRDFIAHYIAELCHLVPNDVQIESVAMPSEVILDQFVQRIPPMPGAEYCTIDVLKDIWIKFDVWIQQQIKQSGNNLSVFLAKYLPLWHQVGRVCFHLAENKQDLEYPFAFLATYAVNLKKNARVQYQPLSQALQEYAGLGNKTGLANLLKPIYKAAKKCNLVKELLDNNDLYHALSWDPQEAYEFLKSLPQLEEAGLIVHLPDWWKKRTKPRVQVSIGNAVKKSFDINALLDFNIDVAIEGEPLTKEELDTILLAKNGLVFLRGQWVEVNKDQLKEALAHWEKIQDDVANGGITFIEGMRLLAGAGHDLGAEEAIVKEHDWTYVEAGEGLKEIIKGLRNPESLNMHKLGSSLRANLRPYQAIGVNWLEFLTNLGLGACLADDMGLGKTIQIIALLLVKKRQRGSKVEPSVIILPASLLANWKSELSRFAPSLKVLYFHGSEISRSEMETFSSSAKANSFDLVITTYGMLLRQTWLKEHSWELIILDEAQAIKNPTARQTKATKELQGKARIVLTGTPVENRLGDLWSLFDFIAPGLLGSSSRFRQFIKSLEKQEHTTFSPLRKLIQPYILRRLKTDKSIISDLPDKTELTAWCGITKKQAELYAQSVRELSNALQNTDTAMKRRGLVLSYLMRFKQICNHPSQMLGDGEYIANKSGKFMRLKEICDEIASRQEKVLIFTQYREITNPLALFLEEVFGQAGLILHGGTPVAQRRKLVERFQQEQSDPFFVLSLKAGGTGLNLTAASHVIHFDRWWNPAVENQATDRAYRIGQKNNILVHKFVCRGTVEEKIDLMITEKAQLADDVLGVGGERLITELNDDELIDLVSLDLNRAQI